MKNVSTPGNVSLKIIWQGCQTYKQERRKGSMEWWCLLHSYLEGIGMQGYGYWSCCFPISYSMVRWHLKLCVTYREPLLFSSFSWPFCCFLCGWVILLATPLLATVVLVKTKINMQKYWLSWILKILTFKKRISV